MSSGTRKAGRLLRISDARDGDTEGVDRQGGHTLALCDRMGWADGGEYIENDTSAFKRKRILLPDGSYGLRTVRPEFRRFIADLQSGAITAGAAYDLDRVARDPRDLEDLIDVVEHTGAPVRAHTGNIDLSTDAGIFSARIIVAHANMSSRDSSRRIRDKHDSLATSGRYAGGGRRPFGYARDGITLVPGEAEAARTMAELYLAGSSLSEIARQMDAAGVTTVTGSPWNVKSVSGIIMSPRAVGLREHNGKIIGPAVWPPLLDRETWDALQIARKERVHVRPAGFQRWLTGVLSCGREGCGHRMRGWSDRGRAIYWCPKLEFDHGCGRTAARAVRVEEFVRDLIIDYLSNPVTLAELNDARHTGATVNETLRAEVRADEELLKDMAGMWGRREISTAEYTEARKSVAEHLATLTMQVRKYPSRQVQAMLDGDIAENWAGAANVHRREVARMVFPDGIRILPATRFGPVFDHRRIQPMNWHVP